VADLDWYVRHEVSDTLRQQMKRYWRYGFANVWMTRLTTAPESYAALAVARRSGHWRHARSQFRPLFVAIGRLFSLGHVAREALGVSRGRNHDMVGVLRRRCRRRGGKTKRTRSLIAV